MKINPLSTRLTHTIKLLGKISSIMICTPTNKIYYPH